MSIVWVVDLVAQIRSLLDRTAEAQESSFWYFVAKLILGLLVVQTVWSFICFARERRRSYAIIGTLSALMALSIVYFGLAVRFEQ